MRVLGVSIIMVNNEPDMGIRGETEESRKPPKFQASAASG